MVRIVDSKEIKKEDGTIFYALIVQGGVEVAISKESGKPYFTARKAQMASTFDLGTCKSLIGTELPGEIKKVQVIPYKYVNKETGDSFMMSHRYEYVTEEQEILQKNVVEKEMVV